MSDSAAADHQDRPEETATPPVPPYEPVRVVPTRPDGWPDWLGRKPVSSADRGKILRDLQILPGLLEPHRDGATLDRRVSRLAPQPLQSAAAQPSRRAWFPERHAHGRPRLGRR